MPIKINSLWLRVTDTDVEANCQKGDILQIREAVPYPWSAEVFYRGNVLNKNLSFAFYLHERRNWTEVRLTELERVIYGL
jgi:hypothetical protein